MLAAVALIPLLLSPAAPAQRVPAGTPQTSASASLATLFEHARRHETEAVLRLGSDPQHSGDRLWEISLYVALYIASPEKYRREFVDHFPVDTDGIMRILYEKIELPKLTPKWLFSFSALGEIAQAGDVPAIERCLAGLPSAQGEVAESYCASWEKISESQAEPFHQALLALPGDHREAISACFSAWDPDKLRHLESWLANLADVPGGSAEQRARIQALLGSMRAAQATRRARAASESGIEGLVLIGPTRPAVRVGDDTPDEAPYATLLQVVAVADGSEVARCESGQDGKFRAALPPGEYLVRQAQEPGRRYPVAVEIQVQVKAGKFSFVTLHLDSGLR